MRHARYRGRGLWSFSVGMLKNVGIRTFVRAGLYRTANVPVRTRNGSCASSYFPREVTQMFASTNVPHVSTKCDLPCGPRWRSDDRLAPPSPGEHSHLNSSRRRAPPVGEGLAGFTNRIGSRWMVAQPGVAEVCPTRGLAAILLEPRMPMRWDG
jgi:hypothetical protein